MELRILGPVELVVAGRTVYLARRQQRLILGILAMEANRLVPLERLINLVWNGNPPRRARAVLQTRVSEIRATLYRHLGDRRFLATRDGGYLLNIAPEKVDLHRFRRLLRDARQAESDVDARQLLRTANDLWRGPVLEGWPSTTSHGSLHADIEEVRLAANEDLWELELKLGNHLLVVDEITQAVTRNPDRERLVGLAMTALHRSGRTAAALRQFEHNRHWLAAEMGIDPSAQLRELYLAMLTSDTATDPRRPGRPTGFVSAVPHLLPSFPGNFTGRENEAARTRTLLTADSRSVRLAVVTGPAGVGKTTLSIHVAHQLSSYFTDGQLYADLRGYDRRTSPDAAKVLAGFLRAFRVSHVPDEIDERANLYRNLLAGRRVLVVLDNARDVDQVRILMPGTASCAVLVNSRARLGAAMGAASTELRMLGRSAALDLLTSIVGRARIDRERTAAVEIIQLCGGLPLAIRVVAGRLNAKPHWALRQLQVQLADERRRLDLLADGGLDVRASILLSYDGLSVAAKTLLCRLGNAGVTETDVWSSAALLEASIDDAQEVLEELHDARLLDANGTGTAVGHYRYRLRQLVRLVAAEQMAP